MSLSHFRSPGSTVITYIICKSVLKSPKGKTVKILNEVESKLIKNTNNEVGSHLKPRTKCNVMTIATCPLQSIEAHFDFFNFSFKSLDIHHINHKKDSQIKNANF